MAYVWKPVMDPPCAREISLHSPDIQKVLQVIRSQRVIRPKYLTTRIQSDAKLKGKPNQVYQDGIKSEDTTSHPPVEAKISSRLPQHETSSPILKAIYSLSDERAGHRSSKKQTLIAHVTSPEQHIGTSRQENINYWKDPNPEGSMDSRICAADITADGNSIRRDAGLSNDVTRNGRLQSVGKSEIQTTGCTLSKNTARKRCHSHHDENIKMFEETRTNRLRESAQNSTNFIRGHGHLLKSPMKKEEAAFNSLDVRNFRNITSLEDGDDDKRQELIDGCLGAAEILLQLSYMNGGTQMKKSSSSAGGYQSYETVDLILLAAYCPGSKLSGNQLNDGWILLSVPILKLSPEEKLWCQRFLLAILSSGVRKICYDAQELISLAMTFCQVDFVSVASKWVCLDPRVACWLLDPDNPPINISSLLTRVLLDGKPRSGDDEGKIQQIASHTGGPKSDFIQMSQCMKQLYHQLCKTNLWDLFLQVEMPLIPLLAGMELSGIQVDPQKFYYASTILKNRTSQLEQLAHAKAGRAFQLNSHVQLRQILFDELKLDESLTGKQLERTAGQNLKSTSENVLSKLQDVHPLPGIILEYRKMQKLKSTYVDGYIDFIRNNCIHCNWEQTAAVSGRLQSTNPNVQNIPKQPVSVTIKKGQDETHRILHMREPFVSRDGHSLISADFQSIELRILAHFSNDELLLGAFKDEDQVDIFVQMTSQWLDLPVDKVKEEDREKTKRIVYSIVYGAGSEKIAEILKVSKASAKSFTNSFLDMFSGIKRFTQLSISQCRQVGFVRTLLHRRRLIKNICSANTPQRLHAERQAVNFVIQGSAADVCKLAMLATMREFAQHPHLKARLLIQIHDELLFEVPDHQIKECKELISTAMESVAHISELGVNLKTRLPISLSVGKDWGHLIKC